jgi:hypothetical protein
MKIAQIGDTQRFVNRNPAVYNIAQFPKADFRIFLKSTDNGTVCPTPGIFQRLGQVPVVNRGAGGNAVFVQFFAEAAVIGYALFVHFSRSGGDDTRPGNGKTVAVKTEFRHERRILGITVVLIAGNLAAFTAIYRARLAGKSVPNALAASAFVTGAFNLITGSGGSPDKIFGKNKFVHNYLSCYN